MTGRIPYIVFVVLTVLAAPRPGWAGNGATAGNIEQATTAQRAIQQALREEGDLRRLEVAVAGSEATLTGLVPHLFAKNEAIRLALEVDGIETVVSEIELPEPVPDADLAKDVANVITDYVHYTMWDYLDVWVNEGVVTLAGAVTPDRDKKGDLYKKIARIPGIQDYVDRIQILSVSSEDERIRAGIENRIFRSDHFDRYYGQIHPPFAILVHNSVVTLKGYVRNQIEYLEMERLIIQMGNVLRVDNQLEVVNR